MNLAPAYGSAPPNRVKTGMANDRPTPFDDDTLEHIRRLHRLDPHRVREFRTRLFKHFRSDEEIATEFPWSRDMSLHALNSENRFDSTLDGASKLVMKTSLGMLIETIVLRIASGRTTLCVSSQVGCGAACEFCATARMGVAVNLSPAEIADQVLLAGQLLAKEDRRVRNIVFMGMGEPFHNEAHLFQTLDLLTSPLHFDFAPRRILVSSVGVADGMLRCAERFPNVGLALSLHSVDPDVRRKLIPLTAKYGLEILRETLQQINRLQSMPVMIEYLMLRDINDRSTDASELARWLSGLNVHVNLIPYNEIDDSELIGSDRPTIEAFALTLKTEGINTTIRYSLGSDIGAACGQLVQRENRRIAKELAASKH